MEHVLASLAYLDAIHDFGDVARTFKPDIAASLPGEITELTDEEEALDKAATYSETLAHIDTEIPDEIFQNLGGTSTRPVAIVCDSSFCAKLITSLQRNTIGQVYYVVNREILTDPGTNMKPKETDVLSIARDTDPNPIRYKHYTSDDILATPNLHSHFDIELTHDGVCNTYNGETCIERVLDLSDNEKNRVKKLINMSSDIQIRQSGFLRKRAGDWLQALSCIDAERIYTVQHRRTNLKECSVYFCSSDRVAIAFALLNDINCILKRGGSYYVYKSKRPPIMSIRDRTDYQIFLERQRAAQDYIPLLNEGIETYRLLRRDWDAILATVSSASTFDRVKELIVLAFHYTTLDNFYAREYDIARIETFIRDPFDPMFTRARDGEAINHAINNFERSMRRYKYLRMYDVSDREKYYKLFSFENTSLESTELLYGSILFSILLTKTNPTLETFAINAMRKVIELTNYDTNVSTLYRLIVDSRRDSMSTRPAQFGGGRIPEPSVKSMRAIGDYLTRCLLSDNYDFITLYLAEYSNMNISYTYVCEPVVEYLVYKKNIIPAKYIDYVTYMNEDYEPGEGPMSEMEAFLKRQSRRKTLNYRNYRNKIHNNTTMRINRSIAVAARRRKSRKHSKLSA